MSQPRHPSRRAGTEGEADRQGSVHRAGRGLLAEDALLFQMEEYSGPVPPPALIDGYQKAVPNGGQQVLDFAMREQLHRHHAEDQAQRDFVRMFALGQLLGFALALVIVVGGFILIKNGDDPAGYAALIVGAGALIRAALKPRRLNGPR